MAALIGPGASAQEGAEGRARSAARMESMQRLANGVKVRRVEDGSPGPPLVLRPDPLLRYGDSGRSVVDGTLWAWGGRDDGRPSAVMKLELRGPGRGERFWAFGVTALAPIPIAAEFADGQRWTSRPPGGLVPSPVPDAPAPAESGALRLAQAKAIARRFTVGVETDTVGHIELRLLPKPIDEYRRPEARLLSGVLFSLVYATNPVALLLLEAGSEKAGERVWRYAFARQGTGEATALLDGKKVWTVPMIHGPIDTDLYMARSMAADAADQY